MTNDDWLRARYFSEYQIWKVLDNTAPVFRYVQDPVFTLSKIEENIIDFLHDNQLDFTLKARYDPAAFITLKVRLNKMEQDVRIEVTQSLSVSCVFFTKRTPFADVFKGWLDRAFGSERFNPQSYVATRYYVVYPYVLPLTESINMVEVKSQVKEIDDSRQSRHLFNFDLKEQFFLDTLEKTVLASGEVEEIPFKVLVYPRQVKVGSIEIVLSYNHQRQPARVFATGFRPMTFEVITENTPIGFMLKEQLDLALGKESMQRDFSRLTGRFLTLVYTVRAPGNVFDDFEY